MASKEPQARESHAYVGAGLKLYIWGGFFGRSKAIDTKLRTFDVVCQTWESPQELRGSCPVGLYNMAVTSDGESGYTFGGTTGVSPNKIYYNTLHQFDPSTLQCRELTPRNPDGAPKKTAGSDMVYYDRKLVVYGGRTGSGAAAVVNHLSVFDLKTNEWSTPPTTGQKPPPLSRHSFTKIDEHRAVIFAGYDGHKRHNDTFVLDMREWHWTKLEVSKPKPPTRSHHTTSCIAGPVTGQEHPILMVVGGYGVGKGDVWLLDVDNGVWSEVNLPTTIPPRDCHSAVLFGSGTFKVMVLYGGCDKDSNRISWTTLLFLELKGGSWQVVKVVKPDQLGKPNGMLTELMKRLELSPQKASGSEETKDRTQNTPNESKSETQLKASSIIDISEITIGKRLGQGGFGAVFEAKWKKRTVAVKVCLGNLLENLSREIQILTSLPPHSNVLTFYGVALSSDAVSTYLITELATNGSLYDYLHNKDEKPSPDQCFAWALQIASGMQHLHNNNIVHRDLKSGNILLSFGMFAKVCDFGTARTMAKTAMTTQKGTYRWMAPEIVKGVEANVNKMCDVFSYGMVLYEIYARKIPYDDIPTDPLVGMAVLTGKRPPVPAAMPPFLHPLLEACWKDEPSERPQFKDIVMTIQTGSFEI